MDQTQKAITFCDLHHGKQAFVMPNPWDAGSARLLESLGFAALATTSAGLAFSLARPDAENAISRDEALQNAAAIVNASTLPVSADLEGGFGSSPETCAETILMAAKMGLVGGSIEDATGKAKSPLYSLQQATERVRAAAEAASSLPFPFMLTARAENHLYGHDDLKDTIKRLQAFQGAGAHVLFAPGLRTADDIRTVTSSVDLPLNVVMGLRGLRLTVSQLSELGVKRISVGASLSRVAFAAVLRAAREMRETGSFDWTDNAVPFKTLNDLFAGKG
jgi:2-methylisocitrate lyase-like PEP mutase family enzyme